MRWLLLSLALVGCGVSAGERLPLPKPDQERALAIVLESFGQSALPMSLEWVERWDCGDGAFINVDGNCVAGTVEWESPPRVRVAWEPEDKFSTTPLAHELCHLHYGDADHKAECGTVRPVSKVVPAEQALRDAGL